MSRRYDPSFDAYAVLGVAPRASREEIEVAYRQAVLLWHPDKSKAPDALERFHDVQAAGEILRNDDARREYDRMRGLHRWQPPPKPEQPEGAHTPMKPPPAWMAERVKVHFDSVMFTVDLQRPPGRGSMLMNLVAAFVLGIAFVKADAMAGLLALVVWAIGRVIATPPHKGKLAWAKITPGRRRAEFHSLDQTTHVYQRHDVPFQQLVVAVVRTPGSFRIEIQGFPREAIPVLLHTKSLREAQRCAREAGRWLQLPTAA